MLFFVIFIPFVSAQIIRDEIDICLNKKCNQTHSTCGFDNGRLNCVDYDRPGSTVMFITKKFRFPKSPTFVFVVGAHGETSPGHPKGRRLGIPDAHVVYVDFT